MERASRRFGPRRGVPPITHYFRFAAFFEEAPDFLLLRARFVLLPFFEELLRLPLGFFDDDFFDDARFVDDFFDDFFDDDLVFSDRSLFTVAAAISVARPVDIPRFLPLSLMCSY